MAYLGKGLKSISTANITVDKMTGNEALLLWEFLLVIK